MFKHNEDVIKLFIRLNYKKGNTTFIKNIIFTYIVQDLIYTMFLFSAILDFNRKNKFLLVKVLIIYTVAMFFYLDLNSFKTAFSISRIFVFLRTPILYFNQMVASLYSIKSFLSFFFKRTVENFRVNFFLDIRFIWFRLRAGLRLMILEKINLSSKVITCHLLLKNTTKWSFYSSLSFVISIFAFAIITIWTRASGPRVRLEQLSKLVWKDILFILLFILFFLFIAFSLF